MAMRARKNHHLLHLLGVAVGSEAIGSEQAARLGWISDRTRAPGLSFTVFLPVS
jgi:hypothetical protein